MFYLTNEARISACKKLDDLILDLLHSEGAIKDLGYTEVREIAERLSMLQRAIEREMRSGNGKLQ